MPPFVLVWVFCRHEGLDSVLNWPIWTSCKTQSSFPAPLWQQNRKHHGNKNAQKKYKARLKKQNKKNPIPQVIFWPSLQDYESHDFLAWWENNPFHKSFSDLPYRFMNPMASLLVVKVPLSSLLEGRVQPHTTGDPDPPILGVMFSDNSLQLQTYGNLQGSGLLQHSNGKKSLQKCFVTFQEIACYCNVHPSSFSIFLWRNAEMKPLCASEELGLPWHLSIQHGQMHFLNSPAPHTSFLLGFYFEGVGKRRETTIE